MTIKQTEYVLESEEESSRLSNQHDIIKDEMGGLVLAPVDLSKPLRILDSATADGTYQHGFRLPSASPRRTWADLLGTWIRDLASSTAPVEHQFVGTDLEGSNFPASPPAGQTYQVQDMNQPWPEEWKGSFDLVHQRLALVGAGPGGQQVIEKLAALVKPGGWMQLIEATNNLPEEDGPAMRNLVTVMKGVFKTYGASLNLGTELPGMLSAAGFEDVQSRIANTKLGAINPNKQLARQGVYSTMIAARGLAKFGGSKCLYCPSIA